LTEALRGDVIVSPVLNTHWAEAGKLIANKPVIAAAVTKVTDFVASNPIFLTGGASFIMLSFLRVPAEVNTLGSPILESIMEIAGPLIYSGNGP